MQENTARMMGPSLPPSPPESSESAQVNLDSRANKMEFARKAIEANEKEGITFENYAKAYGIKASALGYYVSEYRKAMGLETKRKTKGPRKAKLATQPQLPALTEGKEMSTVPQTRTKHEVTIEELQRRVHELEGKLADANVKIKSLMNMVILAGHQLGDEA